MLFSQIDVISFLNSLGAKIASFAAPFSIKLGDNLTGTKTGNEIRIDASGGGVTDHAALSNLDYASSGHTGFQPAGSYLTSPISESDVTNLVSDLAGKEPALTKGNLTATSPILIDQIRQVIGGAAVISLAAAYMPREKLSADRTYYVRTDGSDSNDGLSNSTTGAFLTWQKAVNVAASLDFNGYKVSIKAGNSGTFTATVAVSNFRPTPGEGGSSSLTLEGDTTTPSNVVIQTSTSHCFFVNAATVEIKGFKTVSTSGHGIYATSAAIVNWSNMEFGATALAHMQAYAASRIRGTGNYTCSGSAPQHFLAQIGGIIEVTNGVVTITGTPNFSDCFALANNIAQIICAGLTFSGSATGKRYNVIANSLINTGGGGATYLPGSVAGTTSTGGQYI